MIQFNGPFQEKCRQAGRFSSFSARGR
jgi:hypothetical protein